MNYVAIIQAVAQMLPVLISLIRQVEDTFPQSGIGAQKLDMVMQMMQAAMEAAGQAQDAFNQIKPVVVKTIASIVAIFNATGVFKK